MGTRGQPGEALMRLQTARQGFLEAFELERLDQIVADTQMLGFPHGFHLRCRRDQHDLNIASLPAQIADQ